MKKVIKVPVKIDEVTLRSLADLAGIKSGEILISINNNEINDGLDYEFYIKSKNILLYIENINGEKRKISIKKSEYQELGLEFNTYLIDKQHSCKNKCIFCFIDQLPKGMRESLYFKDDDERLSFLFGNYITLTNLNDKEVKRIIDMHISPINISVHAMNKELRVKMTGNRFAGEKLKYLFDFAKSGIIINTQLVLCPGINDGEELIYSLNELEKLMPLLSSIAVVPVGLTKFRENLFKLDEFNKETAKAVIDIAESYGEKFINKYKKRIIYPADEFYIKAGLNIPPYEFYDDFAQLENGVGLIALMKNEFMQALKFEDKKEIQNRKITLATSVSAYPFICSLVDEAKNKWHNLDCNIIPIVNDFFGETIDVAGLITGTDLISQLKNKDLGDKLLLPAVILRKEQDKFLDDITVEQLSDILEVPIGMVPNNGAEFLYALIE